MIRHFCDRYAVQNANSSLYGNLNLINFSINPEETMKNEYMGGFMLEDN